MRQRQKPLHWLLGLTLILGMMLGMSTVSWAAEKTLEVGVTYEIGDTINVEADDIVIIWDDAIDIPSVIDPGVYTVGSPEFEKDFEQYLFSITEDDDYIAIGDTRTLTGREKVTGFKCVTGNGTEAEPYEFKLVFAEGSVTPGEPVKYLEWDNAEKKLAEKTCTEYEYVDDQPDSESETVLGEEYETSWYVVDGNVTISGRLETEGDVNLILTDGSILNAGGVSAEDGSLTICSQSTGSNAGRLITSSENDYLDGAIESYGADIIINGGIINSSEEGDVNNKSRIYCQDKAGSSESNDVVINGGEITAICASGSGIESDSAVKINGGKITAITKSNGEGGIFGYDKVEINGGEITAVSEYLNAGIRSYSDVEINGGTVTARGLKDGKGIEADKVTINGGVITATGNGNPEVKPAILADNELLINSELIVMAGDSEETAKDVTEEYKNDYIEKLTEQWVKISYEQFTVTFVDWQGNTLKTELVNKGGAATAPEAPARTGYTFKGWDKDFSNITEELTVTAEYNPILVVSVRFHTKPPKSMNEGDTVRLSATVNPSNALNRAVKWSSSDESILTVSENGQVTAVKPGKAAVRIEATDGSGKNVSRVIKVTHALVHKEAVAVTCTQDGNIDCWACSKCGKYFSDETAATEIDKAEAVQKAPGHDWSEWTVTKAATAKAAGMKERTCSRCGEKEAGVVPVSIKNAKVVLSAKAYTYSGKVRRPAVKTVGGKKLTPGTDYTVKWSNASSKNVGTYTVTITGKGGYTGVTKATYKINPKGTSLKKPAKAKKAITVKWKKQGAKMSTSRITGYQIQLATDSKFTKNRKTVTVKGYKKVSKKVTKLKAKKKYYIRIRTYKTVSGKNYYSGWSKVKTAKTR